MPTFTRIATSISTLLLIALIAAAHPATAQTFTVLHSFTGGADGSNPTAGLAMDAAGNLYGTASTGGNGYGTVYKLTHRDGGWTFAPLYKFGGGTDGATPLAAVAIGSNGSLYGTTSSGGVTDCYGVGCGTVYNLTPPPTVPKSALTPWNETVLYRFSGSDGGNPQYGTLTFDAAGNLYGTTLQGGAFDAGTVYELTHSNGGWAQSILYSFTQGEDGGFPWSGVVFDRAGNLYGTTGSGGNPSCNFPGCGVVYRLIPSGSGWAEQILQTFGGDGYYPIGGVTFDSSGNLFGTTTGSPGQSGATVYEISSTTGYSVIYTFDYVAQPYNSLTIDASGNLYGTTSTAYGLGNVFKLSHSNGGWLYTSLHDFTGGADGAEPYGSVILDAQGHLWHGLFRRHRRLPGRERVRDRVGDRS